MSAGQGLSLSVRPCPVPGRSRPGDERLDPPRLGTNNTASSALRQLIPARRREPLTLTLVELLASGEQWRAKPVGFVSYGGPSGGLRAVEALRIVFAEFHAVSIRNTVSFHSARAQFDEHGVPRDPAAVNAAADALLDQLTWWAQALRTAKTAHPYVP